MPQARRQHYIRYNQKNRLGSDHETLSSLQKCFLGDNRGIAQQMPARLILMVVHLYQQAQTFSQPPVH
jgi:hypothetical protein